MAKGLKKYVERFDDEELGFEGLLAKGYTPTQAHKIIVDNGRKNDVGAIYAGLRETESGLDLIEESRKMWAGYGLESPINLLLKEYDEQADHQPKNH